MTEYKDLLELLKKHVTLFEELTDIAQAKLTAAREGNIPALEECMKKEQADTLLLRGYDKKRLQLQKDLSFEDMSFRQLIPLLPEDISHDFSDTFRQLQDAYTRYKDTSGCAKEAIEINMHHIEVALASLKKRKNMASAEIYTGEGSLKTDELTFKDMKI